ncbi:MULTISPECIES: hypothetical protein [Rhizobium]|uniref:hypothetical protein n=1 Tax=Rhizobium TaxID=379 RepID=UPI00103A23B0|nr:MULTISPECIES: hypothetical protein [Rhizobium]MBB4255287.1 hypothetical protein [Rhizobium sp. BK008]TCA10306.1 hypothetical protein E0H57_05660 [Rhizobium leguminosarum bv. viciae]
MSDNSKSLAELAAMKARGELTVEQFEDARKLLSPAVPLERPNVRTPQAPKKSEARRIIVVLLALTGGFWGLGKFIESKNPAAQERAKQEALAESNKKADDKRKGFHCLSAWDGSNRHLVDAVKESLRDPSSFEHAETKIGPVNEQGLHFITMNFRAKNGFGGTNIESATGIIRQSDCLLISWKLVSS